MKRRKLTADEIACEHTISEITRRDLELSKKRSREPWEKTTVELAQCNLDHVGADVTKYRQLVRLYSQSVCGAKSPFVVALTEQLHTNPKYKPLLNAIERDERAKLEAMPSSGGVQ